VERIHREFPTHAQSVLSKPVYAPYLLVQLVDKQAFIAQKGNHEVFRACLENTGAYELEELSKIGEVEDRFVKFLKHIEILAQDDPSKAEGQKLITLIFSIEKYKAY
jgi:hypothetical protein